MRYRLADLIDIADEKWRRRLGWSPVTYLRATVLIVREASIQIIPFRPRYIVGLGREWYFNPRETRIRVRVFAVCYLHPAAYHSSSSRDLSRMVA